MYLLRLGIIELCIMAVLNAVRVLSKISAYCIGLDELLELVGLLYKLGQAQVDMVVNPHFFGH